MPESHTSTLRPSAPKCICRLAALKPRVTVTARAESELSTSTRSGSLSMSTTPISFRKRRSIDPSNHSFRGHGGTQRKNFPVNVSVPRGELFSLSRRRSLRLEFDYAADSSSRDLPCAPPQQLSLCHP